MKICYNCKKEIQLDGFVGRQELCSFCGAALHCCLNCMFYDTGAYNNCREVQAERVLDKTRSNFCDYFRVGQAREQSAGINACAKLEALFKN